MRKISLCLAGTLLGFNAYTQDIRNPDSLNRKMLEEVIIKDFKNRYKVDSSSTVSKLPLKYMENPQVYQSVSKNLFKDQVVTNLNLALRNATGISRLWESTGRGGDGAEYYSMRGFAVQPTLVNGMASITNAGMDPINIETIEIVKGPSGTLFGGNVISYGGLINVVTKQPHSQARGEINFTNGAFGLRRITADYNLPLSEQLAVRINVANNSEDSFQDAGFSKSTFIAPSLLYKASPKLKFIINSEMRFAESANAPMIFLSRYSPLSFRSMELFEKSYRKSFTANSLSISNPTHSFQGQMLYDLGRQWKSQTVLSSSNTRSNGYYQYLWDSANGSDFTRFISKRDGLTRTTGIQQNFTGDFKLGKVRNRLVLGLDYLEKTIDNSSSGWVAHGLVSLKNQTDDGKLTPQAVDQSLLNSFEGVSSAKTKISSIYASNVVNLTDNLSAMLSLRLDHFEGLPNYWSTEKIKGQVNLSPKFGLVYQAIPEKLSLFSNYMNGFTNLDPAQVANVDGSNPRIKIFDPEQANQFEFGTKANLYQDNVSLTLSYYSILVANKVMTDPGNVNNSIQGGEVSSRGFEASVVTNPIKGLNIIAGYSFNQSEVEKHTPSDGYLGLRPEEAGPDRLANFWANYKFTEGGLKYLGIGLGANYASEHKTLNRANIGTFSLPGYAVYNAALSYSRQNLSMNLKLDNMFNEKYYTGWSTITAQRPRSLSVGLNYMF